MKFVIYPKHAILRPLSLVIYLLLSLLIYFAIKPTLYSYFSEFLQNDEVAKNIVSKGMSYSIAVVWFMLVMIYLLEYFRPILQKNENNPLPAIVLLPVVALFPLLLFFSPVAILGEILFQCNSLWDMISSLKTFVGVVLVGIIALSFYLPMIERGTGKEKSNS